MKASRALHSFSLRIVRTVRHTRTEEWGPLPLGDITCWCNSLTKCEKNVLGTLWERSMKAVVVGSFHIPTLTLWGRSCGDGRVVPTTTASPYYVSLGRWNVHTTTAFMALSLSLSLLIAIHQCHGYFFLSPQLHIQKWVTWAKPHPFQGSLSYL